SFYQGAKIQRSTIIRQYQDTNQKTEIRKAGYDKSFVGCGDGRWFFKIKPDQQKRRNAHEFPENIYLKNVGREDKPQHRKCEKRKEGKISGETFFSFHI